MARTKAQLADNFRESDFLTLASLLGVVPFEALCNALTKCGLATQRYRKLPLELMAYYVVCRSQYSGISLQEVMRCILEGFDWLKIKIPCGELKGRGGISRARSRLGYKVMQYLFEDVCNPTALPDTILEIGTRAIIGAAHGSTLKKRENYSFLRLYSGNFASRPKTADQGFVEFR